MSLAKKTALLTIIGVVLAVVVFGFLSLRAVNQATDAMLEDRLITAGVVADYLDESLGRAVTELHGAAQTIDGLSITPESEGKVAALQDIYGRLSVYVKGIYLVDKQGKVIWRAPGALVMGSDASFDASISQMLTVDSPRVSPLVQLPVSDSPVVLLTSPTGASGGEAGVLVVAVDLSQSGIAGFVGPIRLGQTGYVEVVDQNGVVVARTEPGPKLQPFEKSDHSGRFAALIADAKPTRGLCHTCHEPVQIVERRDVLAFMPLTRANWGVAIRQSETEALTAINKLRRDLLLFGIGLIAAALLLVLLTTRDIVSRISVLKTASKRIASGDFSSPVVSSRQDEVGELGRSFEDMRLRLKSSHDELEGRTRELSSLLSVSEILTAIPDLSNLDTALGGALDRILEVMKAERGGIFLLDESEVLRCRVQRGLPEELVANGCRKGFLVETMASRRTTVIPDISKDSREAGFPMQDLRAFAAVPLDAKGQVLGVLSIANLTPRDFTAEEVRLLEDIARQAATVIENARLHEKVQQEDQARGELLREIMSIQEEDRRRIARELHDETSQVLASLTANLEAMSEMLPPGNSEDMKIRLKQAQTLSISVLDDVHRLIYELRPTLLDDLGLVAAARWLADNLKSAGIKVDFKTTGRAKRLPPDVEVALFRVTQEALNNIARHAGAKNAALSLRFRKSNISICIKDDGAGFDVEEAIRSKERPRGLGLLGMKERVELVNGTLNIASRPGSGTEINIEIPLASGV